MGHGTWSGSTTEQGAPGNTKTRNEERRFDDRQATRSVAAMSGIRTDPGRRQLTGDPYIETDDEEDEKSPTTRARAPTSRGCADCTKAPPPIRRWTRFPAGPATA